MQSKSGDMEEAYDILQLILDQYEFLRKNSMFLDALPEPETSFETLKELSKVNPKAMLPNIYYSNEKSNLVSELDLFLSQSSNFRGRKPSIEEGINGNIIMEETSLEVRS